MVWSERKIPHVAIRYQQKNSPMFVATSHALIRVKVSKIYSIHIKAWRTWLFHSAKVCDNYCFPNLYWIHWSITKWSDSAKTHPTMSWTPYHLSLGRALSRGAPSLDLQRHYSWGEQPQKSWCRQQPTPKVDITAESVEAMGLWWHQWWMCNLGTQYIKMQKPFDPKTWLWDTW